MLYDCSRHTCTHVHNIIRVRYANHAIRNIYVNVCESLRHSHFNTTTPIPIYLLYTISVPTPKRRISVGAVHIKLNVGFGGSRTAVLKNLHVLQVVACASTRAGFGHTYVCTYIGILLYIYNTILYIERMLSRHNPNRGVVQCIYTNPESFYQTIILL